MNEQQTQLVKRLLLQTQAGKLDWKPSAEDSTFQVSFKASSLMITRSDSSSGETTYYIQLLNKNGNIVESFSDFDLDSEQYKKPNAAYYEAMRDIYEMARRRALGADKIMREILNELGDDIPF